MNTAPILLYNPCALCMVWWGRSMEMYKIHGRLVMVLGDELAKNVEGLHRDWGGFLELGLEL